MTKCRESNSVPEPGPLSLEDQVVFDILGVLNRVPLRERESILATVGSFVVSEQEAVDEEVRRKLVLRLASLGCRIRIMGRDQ